MATNREPKFFLVCDAVLPGQPFVADSNSMASRLLRAIPSGVEIEAFTCPECADRVPVTPHCHLCNATGLLLRKVGR